MSREERKEIFRVRMREEKRESKKREFRRILESAD